MNSIYGTLYGLLISLLATAAWAQPASGVFFELGKDTKGQWSVVLRSGHGEQVHAGELKVFLQSQWDQYHLDAQAIGGRVDQVDPEEVIFRPILPFTEGLSYVVAYPGMAPQQFSIPLSDFTPTELLAIYPDQDSLPENILKMYLHFSARMAVGKSYTHIYLLDQKGDTIQQPFLDLNPELWNAEGTRLTLWFDPGRVKRALVPNQMLGAPLQEGRHYQLHVDHSWTDASGHPLRRSFTKNFYVKTADRRQPALEQWELKPPTVHSRQWLELEFGEALDHVLLRHAIVVVDQDEKELSGRTRIGAGQRSWQFRPDTPWRAGSYKLKVEARLEDLAGNNLNRPFDRDLEMDREAVSGQVFHWRSFSLQKH